jgi:tetratricopeptide (TPR) repeat protein
MKSQALALAGVALSLLGSAAVAAAQTAPVDTPRFTPDTNNAVIEGRVALPSGFAAERHVRITLKNSSMVLFTRYTDQHGEFRFDNLSEGVYYLQAEVDREEFESGLKKIELGRGIVTEVTLQLQEKSLPLVYNVSRVVSVAELRQQVPATARREYELGLKSVVKGDVAKAAGHFQKAVSIFPEYLAARNDLGAQFLKLHRLDEADEHFQMVIQKDPRNFNAKFNIGLVCIERKNHLDAISQLNQAIAIDSTRPVARLWLGVALLESGDAVSAERELTKALIMGGAECVAAHYHLARIYLSRRNRTEALRAVRAYLQDAPKGEYVKEAKQLEQEIIRK